jgi:hypothetical protein
MGPWIHLAMCISSEAVFGRLEYRLWLARSVRSQLKPEAQHWISSAITVGALMRAFGSTARRVAQGLEIVSLFIRRKPTRGESARRGAAIRPNQRFQIGKELLPF